MVLFYLDHNPLVRLQAEGAVVAHFANKVQRLADGISRNMDADGTLAGIVDGELC